MRSRWLRGRLLWTRLEETGLRLGEALRLRHRDWHTRADGLERLFGDYLCALAAQLVGERQPRAVCRSWR